MIPESVIQPLSLERWQAFDERYGAPIFQARPAWAQALEAGNPSFRPAPIQVQFGNGDNALVPLVRREGGRMRWRIYDGLPLDGHNVILRLDGTMLQGSDLVQALDVLARWRVDALMLNFSPLLNIAPTIPWHARSFEASIVDLRDGADAAIERMDGKSRRMAGQAQRRGVECVALTDQRGIDLYYDLLLLSVKRWGKAQPIVSKAFFEALVEHGKSDVEIWLANFEGRAIAGLVGLYGTQECYVWSAAMDSDMAVLRPHNILHITLMRAAASRGVHWYNLGSSEGLPNVKRFKDGLGAATVPYRRLTLEKGGYRLYRWLSQRLRRPLSR